MAIEIAKLYIKRFKEAGAIRQMKKNARAVGCKIRMTPYKCPKCGMFSVFESKRFGDAMVEVVRKLPPFNAFTLDTDPRPGEERHTYYCMNSKCSKNYYRGYCFRCNEYELMEGLVTAHKRILNIF